MKGVTMRGAYLLYIFIIQIYYTNLKHYNAICFFLSDTKTSSYTSHF
jgi:hypothetical protein